MEKLTEQEFIAKFKKEGFDLYKTKDLKPKLTAFHRIDEIVRDVTEGTVIPPQ